MEVHQKSRHQDTVPNLRTKATLEGKQEEVITAIMTTRHQCKRHSLRQPGGHGSDEDDDRERRRGRKCLHEGGKDSDEEERRKSRSRSRSRRRRLMTLTMIRLMRKEAKYRRKRMDDSDDDSLDDKGRSRRHRSGLSKIKSSDDYRRAAARLERRR